MIDTLAHHIKNLPYKGSQGKRQNYLGTEYHYILLEYCEKSAWTFKLRVTDDGVFPRI